MWEIMLWTLVYAPLFTAHMRTHKENTYMATHNPFTTHLDAEGKSLTYDQVWEKAQQALCEGRWGAARAHIDDLNAYHVGQATDELPTLSDIRLAHGRICPGPYADVIRDRISLYNSHVRRNWGI